MSVKRIDIILETITDPGKRSKLRAVRKYILELDGYLKRLGKEGVYHQITKKYKVTDPNDVYFYEKSGINLTNDITTQIAIFKEKIVKDAINDNVDKDFVENVLAYFCSDVIKIEEIYEELNPVQEERELELIKKIDSYLKRLNKLPWHHLNRDLDKTSLERTVGQLRDRLRKHGLKGIGRVFLVRLNFLKSPKNRDKSLEPVTIEEMEVIANKIEKQVQEWELVITEHALNCEEAKAIKEIVRERKKNLAKITPEIALELEKVRLVEERETRERERKERWRTAQKLYKKRKRELIKSRKPQEKTKQKPIPKRSKTLKEAPKKEPIVEIKKEIVGKISFGTKI